jgi:hypothetical protein
MNSSDDVELGRLGLLALVALAALALLAVSCAKRPVVPAPPLFWEICRDACAAAGGQAAAVVGQVHAEKPACMCAAKEPGT